jgi:hypothetical protein
MVKGSYSAVASDGVEVTVGEAENRRLVAFQISFRSDIISALQF